MTLLKVVFILVLFVSLGLLGYYGYTTIMGKPFWPDWFSSKKDNDTVTGSGTWTKPDPLTDIGSFNYCELEGEDLLLNKIVKYDGTKISNQPYQLKCSECNQYLEIADEGGCVPYTFDLIENDPDKGTGVCTGGLGVGKTCPTK
jgi:hypothetical protein